MSFEAQAPSQSGYGEAVCVCLIANSLEPKGMHNTAPCPNTNARSTCLRGVFPDKQARATHSTPTHEGQMINAKKRENALTSVHCETCQETEVTEVRSGRSAPE